jgi:hypothetical protein
VTAKELIAAVAASQVQRMAVVHRAKRWEVWAHLGPTLEDSSSDRVDPTRWDTLDQAYSWIRTAGYPGTVEVDEASGLGLGYRCTVHRTHAGQWRYGVLDSEGVEVVGGGGYGTWQDAQEAAMDMVADLQEAASDPVFS